MNPPLPPGRPWVGELPDPAEWDCILFVGDTRYWMTRLPTGIVQLTVTDPPLLSIERHRARGTTTRLGGAWRRMGSHTKPPACLWFPSLPTQDLIQVFRDLWKIHDKPSAAYIFSDWETEVCLLTGFNPVTKEVFDPPGILPSKSTKPGMGWSAYPSLCWFKMYASLQPRKPAEDDAEAADNASLVERLAFMSMGYHWSRAFERIMFLTKGTHKLLWPNRPSVLAGPLTTRQGFPTQKPLRVLRSLIRNSSQPGDLVLDPFAGSGSTGEAALSMGRKCLLIEIVPGSHLLKWVAARQNAGTRFVIFQQPRETK